MKGPIRNHPRTRRESRKNKRLPSAWISTGAPTSSLTNGAWLSRETPNPTTTMPGAILVMLGKNPEHAEAMLGRLAFADKRVYVLVGPNWTNQQLSTAPHILARRAPEVPVSAVLSENDARIWIGGGFALRLDQTQTCALRQTFLRLFWHVATEEAWSGGQRFAWRPARERPFDVPEVVTSAAVHLDVAGARLSGDASNALVHLTTGPPPDSIPQRLWFPAGPEHHDRLTLLEQAGVAIVWQERGLPDLLVSQESGELLLPGSRGRLRVRLTADQASEVGQLLESDGSWRFETQVRLGAPALQQAKIWLPGERSARNLILEQDIALPKVLAKSLEAVPDSEPQSWPEANPLALSARYKWTVVPPQVPSGSTEDPLIGQWKKIDTDWHERVSKLRQALETAESERERIGGVYEKLKRTLLGFRRAYDSQLAEVDSLASQPPSAAGPIGAPCVLQRLTDAEQGLASHREDLEKAERKAREDEERERQQVQWQKQIDDAKRKLELRRQEHSKATDRRKAQDKELQSTLHSMKTASKKQQKDLSARQKKLSDEIKRTNKKIDRLNGTIAGLEAEIKRDFVFRPPRSPGKKPTSNKNRFVPQATKKRQVPRVPDEALPEVGDLRKSKGQRYLVIQTWEELTQGEQTASRLSAQLVAPENV